MKRVWQNSILSDGYSQIRIPKILSRMNLEIELLVQLTKQLLRQEYAIHLRTETQSLSECQLQSLLLNGVICAVPNQPLTTVTFSTETKSESIVVEWAKFTRISFPSSFKDLPSKDISIIKHLLEGLVCKILPGSQKDSGAIKHSSFSSLAKESLHSTLPRQQIEQEIGNPQYIPRPRPGDMPDFDDEYEIFEKSVGYDGNSAFAPIGDRDLNPHGDYPQIRPFIDPLRPQPNDGGMFPSPHHPLFSGPQSSGLGHIPGVPPGARYDDPFAEFNQPGQGNFSSGRFF